MLLKKVSSFFFPVLLQFILLPTMSYGGNYRSAQRFCTMNEACKYQYSNYLNCKCLPQYVCSSTGQTSEARCQISMRGVHWVEAKEDNTLLGSTHTRLKKDSEDIEPTSARVHNFVGAGNDLLIQAHGHVLNLVTLCFATILLYYRRF